MGHNIQQKEKKLVTMRMICNLLLKCTKKEELKISYPCQKLVCPLPLTQSIWWAQRICWKFPQLQCSPQKLCQSTLSLPISFNFILKKIRDFLFLCLSLGTKQQGHQGYSWISPTRNDQEVTLQCQLKIQERII